MSVRTIIRIGIVTLVVFLVGAVGLWASLILGAGVLEKFIDARIRAASKDIQETISEAETLAYEGDYVEALRLLFGAEKKERRTWLFSGSLERGQEFPHLTVDAIRTVERQLIHKDQSPLMQWFRDPDVPLQERFEALTELRRLATKKVKSNENILFRGTYNGPLVQLVTSRRLRPAEKDEVLRKLYYVMQESYVSTAQRERIVEEIVQLQRDAEQKFQAQQYVEAFVLMDRAEQKADKVVLDLISEKDYIRFSQNKVDMRKKFVHADESSLMQVFKDQQIPTKERQYLLYELRELLVTRSIPLSNNGTIILQEKEYDGTFVQLLTHPQVEWNTKEFLLISIEVEILKKEPDYTPEHLLRIEEHLNQLRQNEK